MTTRRPLQPLSPPSANIDYSRYAHVRSQSTNDYVAMEAQGQEDAQDAASVVSGLSSLEHDADDFERLMIQNARDERRLNDALHGRVQAFRKARAHPRVGLTMDNLERNNVRNATALGANAHVKFESPPSSSGSTRSDPAIHAPPGWGRKSRTNRNWMRTITYDQEQQQQRTPEPADEAVNGRYSNQYQHHEDDHADFPRQSVEDSPLSHKSSIHGTPRNDRSDWDLTFELNEASIIASTPYIPRNTALEDIRQREIDSLKEQAVTTARLDRIREGSPEQTRRPQSSSNKSASSENRAGNSGEQAAPDSPSPSKRLRTRTNSWQSIGKLQAVTGTGKENSPITVYKRSTETVELASREELGGNKSGSQRPAKHWREDSQDLLRRLARVSNTPSPGRIAALRPQTAPAAQSDLSSPAIIPDRETITAENKESTTAKTSTKATITNDTIEAVRGQLQHNKSPKTTEPTRPSTEPTPQAVTDDVDATPLPVERTILNPKTPVVTGAWVDTPGPRTIRKALNISRSPSQSPKKRSPQKKAAPADRTESATELASKDIVVDVTRPRLPSSALQALVEEARTNREHSSADYGDSTINSLEDLINPPPEGELDEDTLQGLQLPISTPRNEAERQRQQELLHLHRMNDRLRAARTSIRDVSRGIKRVEDQVEHSDDMGHGEAKAQMVAQKCPCADGDGHAFSLWKWTTSFYYDPKLKSERRSSNLRALGGLTGLSIFLIILFTYWISEEIACEMYCHHSYTSYSPYPFGVNPDAPIYPFVIPTLVYRNFIRFWWLPLSSFCSWTFSSILGVDEAAQSIRDSLKSGAQNAATRTAAWAMKSSTQVVEDLSWERSIMEDEVVR